MRNSILATATLLVMGVASATGAQAQMSVYDSANFTNTLQGAATAMKELTQLQSQLQQMQQQYQMFTNPSNITGMLPNLNGSFLQNSMPSVSSMASRVTGAAGTLSNYGQQFFNQNHVYTATGNDAQATLLNRSGTSIANIQGIAAANLASIEQRQANLNEMQTELQDASDIKQVEAVNGRLAIESNAIQGQQAQAANLQALAAAQAQSDQQAAMESIRQGHEAAAAQFTGTLN